MERKATYPHGRVAVLNLEARCNFDYRPRITRRSEQNFDDTWDKVYMYLWKSV